MSFATKLRGLMDELDLSQAQVVALTGIGKTSISQYLSGKNEPHKERQKEIALALGVQENFFQERLPVAEIQADENINLPVNVVAKLMRKSPKFVQQGLQQGRFPWGYAVKLNRWDYWISSIKFSEHTGIKVPYINDRGERYDDKR